MHFFLCFFSPYEDRPSVFNYLSGLHLSNELITCFHRIWGCSTEPTRFSLIIHSDQGLGPLGILKRIAS